MKAFRQAASLSGFTLASGAAALVLALSATSCGVPTSTSPEQVGVPLALSAKPPVFHKQEPPKCSPHKHTSCVANDVYFVAAGTDHLVAVPTQAKTPAALLRALVAGPTVEDAGFGIVTLIPPGAEASIVHVTNRVVTVNLNASFGDTSLTAIAQIVWTLTAQPTKGVLIYQFGAPAHAPTQTKQYVGHPLTRADYSTFGPGS
jgi:spore germination protein GerM